MSKLKAAVIGYGYMGKNHARIYSEHKDVELIGICDTELSQPNNYFMSNPKFYKSIDDLLKTDIDFVSICVPTGSHYEVAKMMISNDIHVLIEKPITNSVKYAKELIQLAKTKHISLGVGHIERFNPVVEETKKLLDQKLIGDIYQINVNRMGPNPNRKLDTGVFLDLATHDIDIVRYLLDEEPISIYSCSIILNKETNNEDLGSSILTFSENKIVNINVNWVSPVKIREMIIIGSEGLIMVNFITQDLNLYENNYNELDWGAMNILKGSSEGKMTKLSFKRDEPLKLEIDAFVDSLRNNKQFAVDGNEGLRSLMIAKDMINSSVINAKQG